MSTSIEPLSTRIDPRSPSPEFLDSPRIIQHASSFDVPATLSDVSEYAQEYIKTNTQRLAIQGHIDQLLEEFDEYITAAETERHPAKKAECPFQSDTFRNDFFYYIIQQSHI